MEEVQPSDLLAKYLSADRKTRRDKRFKEQCGIRKKKSESPQSKPRGFGG
jgi:hypothetical protein